MTKFQNMKNKFSISLALALALAMVISTVALATVWTDQDDYSPGSVVTISGNNDADGAPGYTAGNTANVAVLGPNGWTSACSAIVGVDGTWSCTITLDSDPAIAVGDYTYTATSTDANGNSIGESGAFSDNAESFQSCALTTGGGVKCWGFNAFGGLGNGTTATSNVPVQVTGLTSGVAQVTVGTWYACALTTSGGVKCWGYNGFGQLGDGTITNRTTPVYVSGLTSGVAQISAGIWQTCAVMTSGGAKCWGYNGFGQLGDGTITNRTTPVDVSGLTSGVAQISAGEFTTCVVTTGGGAKCWGKFGLGNGTFGTSNVPVNVSGLTSGVAQISAGFQSACAVTTGGGAKCWGSNFFGNLGDGTFINRATPVDVSGLTSGVAQIRTTIFSTCAVTTGGGAKCWGSNNLGQLGDGTTTLRTTPVDVSGLTSGVAQIWAGWPNACALTTGGGAKCWGQGVYGGNGDGTFILRATPVDVSGLTSGVTALPDAFNLNTPPVCDTVTVDPDPTNINDQPVSVTVDYTDPDSGDTIKVDVDMDDGTESVSEANDGQATVTHTYATPGVYEISATVDDGSGAVSCPDTNSFIVIYDPDEGFVTGGGWIDSPTNTNYQYMQVDGKATFGFVSKYKKGASIPTGNTEFNFKAGDLNFHSGTYQWLVVNQGGANAQFKGEGTVNGSLDPNGNAFKFMLWAGDDSPDTFRIRIWWEGTDSTEYDVYDNGFDQAIGGGNIKIHTGK